MRESHEKESKFWRGDKANFHEIFTIDFSGNLGHFFILKDVWIIKMRAVLLIE